MNVAAIPSAFRYPEVRAEGRHARIRNRVKAVTGADLFPSEEVAEAFIRGLSQGDPVAERFVAETYHGPMGARKARDLVEQALAVGIDNVDDAPESMRVLFEEFERVPEWVDPQLIGEGAAVWRRWGYAFGAVGNAATMDTYTEGSLAVPLSLAGGYAGERALHRYLETVRWWLEVSRPGAILTPGSLGRQISMRVRIMHVSIRARVANHPEWDAQRWGLPISQSEMKLTLLGGSVAPAFALFARGYLTSPHELKAVLHFNRYCGYLLGVNSDEHFPETALEGWRILFMSDAARSYDSGHFGKELVESFVPAFAPKEHHRGWQRVRATYHLKLQAGYSGLFMLPWNRRRYAMPSPLTGIGLLLAQIPPTAAVEVGRRVIPGLDAWWQRSSYARWERWATWQAEGKQADFDAGKALRR